MTDITIPDEVVEAAAKMAYGKRWEENRTYMKHVLRAGLAAWPGRAYKPKWDSPNGVADLALILPLPQDQQT